MYTPERESYEPTIITRTPVRGGRTPIRHWEPAIKENIGTPNNTNSNKYLFYQKQSTPIRALNNTSLTPLIERHSIRDVNPFYQASESEIAETPGMIETPNSSFISYDETPSRMFTIQSKLDDEMRRLEQLHEDLLAIKEQCAFLTNSNSSTKIPNSQRDLETTSKTPLKEVPSWRTRTPIEERRSFISDSQPYKIQKTTHTPLRTPYKEQRTTTPFSSSSFNHNSNSSYNIEEEKRTPKTSSFSIRNTIHTIEKSPLKTPYQPTNNNKQKSPGTELKTPDNSTQEFLNEISSAKLKSTEIIRTPGGSRVANKFWKEIHGKNNNPSTSSPLRYPKSPTRIITSSSLLSSSLTSPPITTTISKKKMVPTPRLASTSTTTTMTTPPPPPPPQPTSLKRKKAWKDGEEEFWSESSPKPTNSTFNNRLFKAAREEKITMSLEEELQSAAIKEQLKPLPLPAVNPDMIAELKARHRERFLDDSDSYKFA